MHNYRILVLLVWITSLGSLSAQTFSPFSDGEYPTSKTEKKNIQGVPVPQKVECKVRASSTDHVEIGFRIPNSRGYSYLDFDRLDGNVFAAKNSEGDYALPIRSFLQIQSADVMEVFYLNGEKADNFVVIAPKGSKFGSLKKATKKKMASFPVSEYVSKATTFNKERELEKLKARKAEEEAQIAQVQAERAAREEARLKKEAQAKAEAAAAAEARKNADLCSPIAQYLQMGSSNFSALKGKLDAEETEMEEEDVFFTNDVPPLFRLGRIVPSYASDSNKNLKFETKRFYKKTDAETELTFIKARIDACYKNKAGFKYTLDSGMHIYRGSGYTLSLMTKNAWDADDGEPKEYVLFQIAKR